MSALIQKIQQELEEIKQQLHEKDAERTLIKDHVENLETLKRDGFSGKLLMTVLGAPNGKIRIDVTESSMKPEFVGSHGAHQKLEDKVTFQKLFICALLCMVA